MWTHTGEYCLFNAVIIIIIYTGIKIKYLKYQTALTYKQEWEQIVTLLFVSAAGCSFTGFPGGSDSKESASSAGDLGSVPGGEDPLEKGMATHSSVLAWKIPWTEESGGLQSMGSQTVRHDRTAD